MIRDPFNLAVWSAMRIGFGGQGAPALATQDRPRGAEARDHQRPGARFRHRGVFDRPADGEGLVLRVPPLIRDRVDAVVGVGEADVVPRLVGVEVRLVGVELRAVQVVAQHRDGARGVRNLPDGGLDRRRPHRRVVVVRRGLVQQPAGVHEIGDGVDLSVVQLVRRSRRAVVGVERLAGISIRRRVRVVQRLVDRDMVEDVDAEAVDVVVRPVELGRGAEIVHPERDAIRVHIADAGDVGEERRVHRRVLDVDVLGRRRRRGRRKGGGRRDRGDARQGLRANLQSFDPDHDSPLNPRPTRVQRVLPATSQPIGQASQQDTLQRGMQQPCQESPPSTGPQPTPAIF